MKQRPVLGDWEIPRIHSTRTSEKRDFVELRVPGMTGSLFQDLNTEPTRIMIAGSLYGDEARDDFLNKLREKYRAGDPVTFVADIVTATEVKYVIVETLRIEESAARPDQVDYMMVLRESPPPPPPPDPLGGLDTSLLDQAGKLASTVTGALDAIEALGNIPNFGDPTPKLKGALSGVQSATQGINDALNPLRAVFGGA